MAEPVGTLLWELRTKRGWSLGQLAKQAGVSAAALSRWESGDRQPRLPELEATLEALGATSAQRVLALSRIAAPRALRRLREPETPVQAGPLPSAGDLLRAMRLRRGWSQDQISVRMGVNQATIARWEQGNRLPSSEQMQALCFALGAQEEEIIALTTGRFAEEATDIPTERRQVLNLIHPLLYDPHQELVELRFLLIERTLWYRTMRGEEWSSSLLATAYAEHAHYLSFYARWEEVKLLASRALQVAPPETVPDSYVLRAVLKLSAAEVYGGKHPRPERGMHLLKPWLPRSTESHYTAWFLSDMGKYLALMEEPESAIALGKRAVSITEREHENRQLDHGRLLLDTGRPGEALDHLPCLTENEGDRFVLEALTRCEAHLNLGKPGEAGDWLARAYGIIATGNWKFLRPQADALAQRL